MKKRWTLQSSQPYTLSCGNSKQIESPCTNIPSMTNESPQSLSDAQLILSKLLIHRCQLKNKNKLSHCRPFLYGLKNFRKKGKFIYMMSKISDKKILPHMKFFTANRSRVVTQSVLSIFVAFPWGSWVLIIAKPT